LLTANPMTEPQPESMPQTESEPEPENVCIIKFSSIAVAIKAGNVNEH